MKKIEFADVYISALTLNTFRGSFDKDALQVVKKNNYKIKEYDMELAIIGASHYISFKKEGEVIFSEVFACVDIAGATQYKDEELRMVKINVFDYSFSSYIFELDKDKYTVERFKKENTLVFEFGETEEFKESAITGLILKEMNGKVELETIHVYPNENKAIVTNSTFNLGKS